MTTVSRVGGGADGSGGRPQRVLAVNAGSTSVKVRLVEPVDSRVDPAGWRVVAAWERPPPDPALGAIVAAVDDGRLLAVAHRVVSAGRGRTVATVIDEDVTRKLEAAAAHSPVGNGSALASVHECGQVTSVPQVACADAAFFATVPTFAATYAVPWEWDRQLGVRVVGRYGLSHAWADSRARQLTGSAARRVVTCHLGWSASLAAVIDGRCVDTTSGFSGRDGLVTSTGSGAVDPGLVTYVQERLHWAPARMRHALEQESGVAGLSGLTGDMASVLQAERLGHERAALAIGVYLHRLRAGVAAMAAALGGLEVLAFTGGVAEHNPGLVRRVCHGLEFLGVGEVGESSQRDLPASVTGDRVLSGPGARVPVALVASREDAQMAAHTRQLLSSAVLSP